jgi:hypothetical protein
LDEHFAGVGGRDREEKLKAKTTREVVYAQAVFGRSFEVANFLDHSINDMRRRSIN